MYINAQYAWSFHWLLGYSGFFMENLGAGEG
jgi:hypothetical protein